MALMFSHPQYLRSIIAYQFQDQELAIQFSQEDIKVEISRRTKKPRYIFLGNNLFATVRATTGRLVLAPAGAQWIHQHLGAPSFRVVINPEITEFIQKGRSLFAKFVLEADPRIRPGDEVILTIPGDQLVGSGRATLSGTEMQDFKKGVAVKPHTASELLTLSEDP